MKKEKKEKFKAIERGIYIILICGLVIYGIKDSDAAVKLIQAVHQAFTLLLNIE